MTGSEMREAPGTTAAARSPAAAEDATLVEVRCPSSTPAPSVPACGRSGGLPPCVALASSAAGVPAGLGTTSATTSYKGGGFAPALATVPPGLSIPGKVSPATEPAPPAAGGAPLTGGIAFAPAPVSSTTSAMMISFVAAAPALLVTLVGSDGGVATGGGGTNAGSATSRISLKCVEFKPSKVTLGYFACHPRWNHSGSLFAP